MANLNIFLSPSLYEGLNKFKPTQTRVIIINKAKPKCAANL